MMRLLMIILAFNFIIIVHELGHFIVAKLSGIKVEEFSLFVGPKIFSIKRGETVYSLRTLPILAYVKMEGEDEASDSEMSFSKKPVWTRAAVIAAGPFANLLAAFIIIVVFYSLSGGYASTEIESIRENSPAYHAGINEGDIILNYDNKKIYQYVEMYQFLYISEGKPTEIKVLRNGEELTMQITPEAKQYYLGFSTSADSKTNIINELSPGMPAEKYGLNAGDEIIKMNDTDVGTLDEISAFLQANKETPINITVKRGESIQVIDVTPFKAEQADYDVGMVFKYKEANFADSLKQSLLFTFSNIRTVVYSLQWLITGRVNLNQMAGPVGIVATMNDAVKGTVSVIETLLRLLNMTAYISVAVGATNLIPFPALDGSKLLLLIVEAVRRKPLPIEKEAIIMTIGFFLLIGLAIFITSHDIYKLIIG